MAQLDTTEDYRRKIEEYFARRPLSRSRRCSPTSRQNGRVPSGTSAAPPAVVPPVQPVQPVQSVQTAQQVQREPSVRRINNNQPEHGIGPGLDDDARSQVNNRDENIIDNHLIRNIPELRLEEVPPVHDNNHQGVLQNAPAVRPVEQYVLPAPIRPAVSPCPPISPARISSNVAPPRTPVSPRPPVSPTPPMSPRTPVSPRNQMFSRAAVPQTPPFCSSQNQANVYVPPARPSFFNRPGENRQQRSVSARRPGQPGPAQQRQYHPMNGQQPPMYRPLSPMNGQHLQMNRPISPRNGQQFQMNRQQAPMNRPNSPMNGQQLQMNRPQSPRNGQQLQGTRPQSPRNGQQLYTNRPQSPRNGQQFQVNRQQPPMNRPQSPLNGGQQQPMNRQQPSMNGPSIPPVVRHNSGPGGNRPWNQQHQRPNNAINAAPQRPMSPRTVKESNERLSQEYERRMHQNFLAPALNAGIVPVVCEPVHDMNGFLEEHQRNIMAPAQIQRPRSSTSTYMDYAIADQSTWVEEDRYEIPVAKTPPPPPQPPAAHVDELLLNIDEPILASSGEPYIAPQVVPDEVTQVAGTTSPSPRNTKVQPTVYQSSTKRSEETPYSMFPEFQNQFGQRQQLPVINHPLPTRQPLQPIQQVVQHQTPAQAPVQNFVPQKNTVPARVVPSSQPVTQRPLSKNLVPNRKTPQPPLRPQPTSTPEQPPLTFVHQDLQIHTVSSRRIAPTVPNHDLPPRVSPTPRPQSSSSIRPQHQPFFESPSNSIPASRNHSIPEAIPPRVPRIPLTSHAAQRSLAMQQQMQAPPQVLRTIQDLPDVGMHDITDVWGLENDTTVPFEQTQNYGQHIPTPVPHVQPTSILVRRKDDIPAEQVARNQEEEYVHINVASVTPESLDGMTPERLEKVVDAMYYGTPREKYKQTYPYLAEGVVQKDNLVHNQLRVFSSRVGKVFIKDSPARGNKDYVYFIVAREGDYRGFAFDYHPRSLVSAKFPNEHKIVIRGYAILGHANFKKSANRAEGRWVCWNDSMGMMNVVSGAARTSLKKQPVWDKQLDIVSISSSFENNSFVVINLVALTNVEEKKKQFPEEVFLAQDMLYRTMVGDDLIFYSPELDLTVSMRNTLIDDFNGDEKRKYEIVVVPTFPSSTRLEFKGILLIDNPMFWSRDKEWVREKLLKRTEAYKADSLAQRQGTPSTSGNSSGTSNSRASRPAGHQFPPRSK